MRTPQSVMMFLDTKPIFSRSPSFYSPCLEITAIAYNQSVVTHVLLACASPPPTHTHIDILTFQTHLQQSTWTLELLVSSWSQQRQLNSYMQIRESTVCHVMVRFNLIVFFLRGSFLRIVYNFVLYFVDLTFGFYFST